MRLKHAVICSLLMGLAMPGAAGRALAADVPPSYAPPPAPKVTDWPDERLVAFLRELADAVHERHVVRDPSRAVFGMTYEFVRDGRHVQDFPLDSMHDGAWLTGALITAHRATGDAEYLKRVQTYHVPFYVNVLRNSDRLFPDYGKTDEDTRAPDHPIKGRIPLAWDDGQGYDFNTGKRHAPGYNRTQGPNHLAQDVADALMNAWLTTRDPAAAEALMLLHRYRVDYFGTVPVIAAAAGVTNGDERLAAAYPAPKFAPTDMPGYAGMYQQNGEPLAAYDDGLGWTYGRSVARAALAGRADEDAVLFCAARALGHVLCMESYFADRPYPYGMHFFDIQGQPAFRPGEGRLDAHLSTDKRFFGARGIQIAWVAAGVLPDLRRVPKLWERYHAEHHANEPIVRIVDSSPATDGTKDGAYAASAKLDADGTSVTLLGDPENLHVYVESPRREVTLTIRHAAPVNGAARTATITLTAEGKSSAVNDKGEVILHEAAFAKSDRWAGELRLPYAAVPGQVLWLNGVEHGRYAVTLNGGPPRVVYFLSTPERVIARLEAISLGAIDTWHAVWKELGVIPSGYRGPNLKSPGWEIGDAGNYAHLIKLISLVLLDRAGAAEWEVARGQMPAAPTPAEPLPESTLKAQGLLP